MCDIMGWRRMMMTPDFLDGEDSSSRDTGGQDQAHWAVNR